MRVASQKSDGQEKHENGANDPVLDQGEGQYLNIFENLRQFLIAHLGQGRIHHQDKTDGDGDVGGAHLKVGQNLGKPWDEIAQGHPSGHGQENP